MSPTMILINMFLSIAIILILIVKLKINPTISLIIGSIFMGLASNMGMLKTVEVISHGFGNLMTGIGLSIGFGVILGKLLQDSGAAEVIAKTMVKSITPRYALYAIGLTGFLLSIPVFYDVTFVILIPLAIAMSKEVKKPLPYAIGAITIGAATSHTLVPPTPNPLASADILHFDLGLMVIFGLGIGLIVSLITMKIFFLLMDKGFWKSENDETGMITISEDTTINPQSPGFIGALLPIITPIILILSGTIYSALSENVPVFILFISNKVIAMFVGTLLAYVISYPALKFSGMEKSANQGMMAAGIVLLITGAGGSFGSVITETGVGNVISEKLLSNTTSVVPVLLLSYFIALVFRIAQGSGTVASITTMTLMAPIAAQLPISPVYIALSCLAGGISVGHINDSGFWVTANCAGFTVSGGLKTYTMGGFIMSVLVLLSSIAFALLIPLG